MLLRLINILVRLEERKPKTAAKMKTDAKPTFVVNRVSHLSLSPLGGQGGNGHTGNGQNTTPSKTLSAQHQQSSSSRAGPTRIRSKPSSSHEARLHFIGA